MTNDESRRDDDVGRTPPVDVDGAVGFKSTETQKLASRRARQTTIETGKDVRDGGYHHRSTSLDVPNVVVEPERTETFRTKARFDERGRAVREL